MNGITSIMEKFNNIILFSDFCQFYNWIIMGSGYSQPIKEADKDFSFICISFRSFVRHKTSYKAFHCVICVELEIEIHLNTGCSLNSGCFSKILKYSGLVRFSVFPRCVYTHQAGRTPALQQDWQSSENFKISKHNI